MNFLISFLLCKPHIFFIKRLLFREWKKTMYFKVKYIQNTQTNVRVTNSNGLCKTLKSHNIEISGFHPKVIIHFGGCYNNYRDHKL